MVLVLLYSWLQNFAKVWHQCTFIFSVFFHNKLLLRLLSYFSLRRDAKKKHTARWFKKKTDLSVTKARKQAILSCIAASARKKIPQRGVNCRFYLPIEMRELCMPSLPYVDMTAMNLTCYLSYPFPVTLPWNHLRTTNMINICAGARHLKVVEAYFINRIKSQAHTWSRWSISPS